MTRHHAAYLALALMLLVSTYAAYELGRGRLPGDARHGLALNLLGSALVWLRCNGPIEGTILLLVSPRHGLTAADLLALLPIGLAALALAPVYGRLLLQKRE